MHGNLLKSSMPIDAKFDFRFRGQEFNFANARAEFYVVWKNMLESGVLVAAVFWMMSCCVSSKVWWGTWKARASPRSRSPKLKMARSWTDSTGLNSVISIRQDLDKLGDKFASLMPLLHRPGSRSAFEIWIPERQREESERSFEGRNAGERPVGPPEIHC